MTYPTEREVEYWSSRAIEDFFIRHGFRIFVIPNSQRAEKFIPFDHLFVSNNLVKMFGLQYKRLEAKPDHWTLKVTQHELITKFGWIYYGLPVVRSWSDAQDTSILLDRLRIVEPYWVPSSIDSSNTIKIFVDKPRPDAHRIPYVTWDSFVQGLFDCSNGIRVPSPDSLREFFVQAEHLREALVDFYAVSEEQKVVLRRSVLANGTLDGGELE